MKRTEYYNSLNSRIHFKLNKQCRLLNSLLLSSAQVLTSVLQSLPNFVKRVIGLLSVAAIPNQPRKTTPISTSRSMFRNGRASNKLLILSYTS